MKSSIFNFLGEFSSTLEELALRIEALLWEQPQAAMTQARLFGETLVSMIFEQENMSEVYPLKQVEKINRLFKNDVIHDEIYKKLEYIRKTETLRLIKLQRLIKKLQNKHTGHFLNLVYGMPKSMLVIHLLLPHTSYLLEIIKIIII